MRIKKLELVGFKSFKDRTVILFDEGITGVVGPNGCGKSNIVDALVWVMGEMSAKHLRGSSMEDVIFAGAEGFAPSGMAEVSLTLENDGGPFPAKYLRHSEVMVTRRLHRSGESEYLVNKEPARLRDIQEIFMDTGAGSRGFSIIEQGQIGRIITAKPEDRRTLIEEAAGITKFKVRKRESQRKLQSTEQNLTRLQDIIGELKRQLDSLQRQAKRAERYRNLKSEVQDLDLWVSSVQYRSLRDDVEEAQGKLDAAQNEEVGGESELSTKQARLEELKAEQAERQNTLDNKQQEHKELETSVRQAEREIQELDFEIRQARKSKEMTGNLLQEYQLRKELLDKDLGELEEKLASLKEAYESKEEEYGEQRETFETLNHRVEELDDQLSDQRREMHSLAQAKTQIKTQHESVLEQVEDVQQRQAQAQEVRDELVAKASEFQAHQEKVRASYDEEQGLLEQVQQQVGSLHDQHQDLKGRRDQTQHEVEEFKDKLNEISSRLYGLEDLQANFEGFQEGVKNLLKWQQEKQENSEGEPAGRFLPVAEVVEVPEEFEVALEAALGQRLQMLLHRDESEVLNALEFLKEQQNGRSSFYMTGAVRATSAHPNSSQVLALMKDIVQPAESYREVIGNLVADIVIVDSVETALSLRQQFPDCSFVTREGDTLSVDGVLTGGAAEAADSGVLKRKREIKELTEQKEQWAEKLKEAQERLKALQEEAAGIESQLSVSEKQKSEKEIYLAELRKDLERAENECRNAQEAVSRQDRELEKLTALYEEKQEKSQEMERSLAETMEKLQGIEEQVEILSEEYEQSRAGVADLQETVTTLKVETAEKKQELDGVERQLEMVRRSVHEVNEQLSKTNQESSKTDETLSTHQVLLEEKRVALDKRIYQAKEAETAVSQLKNKYEEMGEQLRELDKQVSQAMVEKNRLQGLINEAQLKMDQATMKEQYLVEQVEERYNVSLPDVSSRYVDREGDLTEAEKNLKELRSKLSKIGEVNLSAIDEYDELKERYEFLSAQQEDLISAKEQLRKVIDRINRICSRRFKETFTAVNERFIKVFPVLFGGGEAHLILVEDEEKGEMGIDIVAKPPGKKMTSVSLMSGGEKALTAVSLIFAIFLVKPSPYCLLDEVDAPLDDANVFRFNDLVREMAKRSQIIVVTHNKFTMEVSRKLYGVTMEEKGVSKMVSVNLSEAQARAELGA